MAHDILHEIEIYSQGALQQIALSDRPELRLQLIDRPHRIEIEGIRRETEQLVADLKAVGGQLRTVRIDLERKRAEIKELDQLRLELGSATENRPQLPPTLEEQHAVYMRRQRLLEVLSEVQTIQRRTMSDAAVVLRNRESVQALREVCSSISLPETAQATLILDQLQAQIERAADMQHALVMNTNGITHNRTLDSFRKSQ